jgi:hypothetical protein
MRRPPRPGLAWGMAVAVAVTGCGILPIDPLDPGARRWIIPVNNQSNAAVIVAVAEDQGAMGRLVGRADPNPVPPRTQIDVAFTVPPGGQGWAIFVNPAPGRGGPLITASDVPAGRAGRLPLAISVSPNGEPSVSAPNEPGWFGQ